MSGISDAITISGRLVDLVKAGATIEAQEQIAELRVALADAKIELSDLREEMAELKRAAAEREQMEWDGVVYWRTQPDGQKDGPFCQRCLDADAKLIRLQSIAGSYFGDWSCAACNKTYGQQSGTPASGAVKPHF
jgi:hypothetical protein